MMNQIEMILKLMEPELDQFQLTKLKNVLQTILRTTRNAPPNEELIERFVRHKKLVGLKDTTLTGYVAEIRFMLRFLDKGLCDITTADIKDYLSNCMTDGESHKPFYYTDQDTIYQLFLQLSLR